MENSVGRASGLINNVLDLARGSLGGGLVVERNSDAPLTPVLEQVVAEIRVIASGASIETRIDIDEPVYCDRGRLGSARVQPPVERGDPRSARPADPLRAPLRTAACSRCRSPTPAIRSPKTHARTCSSPSSAARPGRAATASASACSSPARSPRRTTGPSRSAPPRKRPNSPSSMPAGNRELSKPLRPTEDRCCGRNGWRPCWRAEQLLHFCIRHRVVRCFGER